MNDGPVETCTFFVDDSNIWIEAQKFAASGNGYMPKLGGGKDHDPRLRIDVGRLVRTLRGDRSQCQSFLYGSRPPPNDSVWNVFKRFKFQTKIYDRSDKGKEKEVDNSMATDLSSQATELAVMAKLGGEHSAAWKQRDDMTFVVITGDRDMLPPVRKVLDSKIRVELWAWKAGISKEYLRLASSNGLLEVNFLDSVFDQISFTNLWSTRKKGEVQPSHTVVLCEFVDPDMLDRGSPVGEALLHLARLFWITRSKSGNELFIEFPDIPNIEAIILKIRELFGDTLTVLSWPQYLGRRPDKNPPIMLESSNRYARLGDDKGMDSIQDTATAQRLEPPRVKARMPDAEQPGGEKEKDNVMRGCIDPDNDEGWQTVSGSNQKKKHHRDIRKSQQCRNGIHCEKGGECGFAHSQEERDLFRDNPYQDFRVWKSKMCDAPHRHRGKHCRFAHGQDEAWCLSCYDNGHFTEACRFNQS